MKRSEMNAHQRTMFDKMNRAMGDLIGGYENTLLDYNEDEEEYKEAYNFLHQPHETLVELLYDEIMNECKAGSNAEHARFAGKAFLIEQIEKQLKVWGY